MCDYPPIRLRNLHVCNDYDSDEECPHRCAQCGNLVADPEAFGCELCHKRGCREICEYLPYGVLYSNIHSKCMKKDTITKIAQGIIASAEFSECYGCGTEYFESEMERCKFCHGWTCGACQDCGLTFPLHMNCPRPCAASTVVRGGRFDPYHPFGTAGESGATAGGGAGPSSSTSGNAGEVTGSSSATTITDDGAGTGPTSTSSSSMATDTTTGQ